MSSALFILLLGFNFHLIGANYSNLFVIQEPLDNSLWECIGSSDPSLLLYIKIAIKEKNLRILRTLVNEISNPDSPKYTNYLSKEELGEITRPSIEAVNAITKWLNESQVTFNSNGLVTSNTIRIHLSVKQASMLFNTEIKKYKNSITQQIANRAGSLRVPFSVSTYIQAVYGLHAYPVPPRKPAKRIYAPAKVTPSVLKTVYNITGITVSGSTKIRQAVVEFQGQYMSEQDLATFFEQYVPDAKPEDAKVYKFVGPHNSSRSGTEALLDIEYMMGVSPGVKTEFWIWPGDDWCAGLKSWVEAILADNDPPLVFSVSYGIQGNVSLHKGCQDGIVMDIENQFEKIAAKGVTIMFSSGDSGAGGTIIGRAPLWSVWPGSAPYVTSVGATMFTNNQPDQPERATTQFGSGGGFSRRWKQPSWQNDAIAHWYSVANDIPPDDIYGKGGRGTPDVSALGEGYQVIVNGKPTTVGGTSASSPTFAGLVSLLNDARMQVGKAPLGFLNPMLYKVASLQGGFTDVTVGNNKVGDGGIPLKYGFECTAGWDPVTGLGTPKFNKLLRIVLSLP